MSILIQRVNDPFRSPEHYRILIDRLWPRGISKERAALDDWMKDIAPSTTLRKWFDHRTDRFEEFSIRYTQELQTDPTKQACLHEILTQSKQRTVILLYAAKNPKINHAVVLLHVLQRMQDTSPIS